MSDNPLFQEQQGDNVVYLSIDKETAEAMGPEAVLELWNQVRAVEKEINSA